MIKALLQTDSDYVYTFLRIIAGIIVFPYGMQKLFRWFSAPEFGPPGIKSSLEQFKVKKVPKFIAWLVIIGHLTVGATLSASGVYTHWYGAFARWYRACNSLDSFQNSPRLEAP